MTHAKSKYAGARRAQDLDGYVVLLSAKLRERLTDGFVYCGGDAR